MGKLPKFLWFASGMGHIQRYRDRLKLLLPSLPIAAVLALLIPSAVLSENQGIVVDGSKNQGSDNQAIVLGMSAAFTGQSRALGIELYRGSAAYFEYINQQGGIDGTPIVIQAYDDGYNPIPSIENTIKLIEEDEVFALFNYVGTPTVTRMLPLLNRYRDEHFYLFFPFTGAQPQRQEPYEDLVFNLRASYREETEGLVDNFVNIGRKKIGIFYQIDAYGRSGWDGVKQGLAKHDLEMVEEVTYRRGTPYSATMADQVRILREANPDAIISVGAYEACAAFIRDARDAGWDVPIANISFVGTESLLQLLRAEEKNGQSYTHNLINSEVVPIYEDLSFPSVKEYQQIMEKYAPALPPSVEGRGYESLQYSFVSFEGFLNAKLLVEILRQMNDQFASYDRAKLPTVIEQIRDLDLGIEAPIHFDAEKHQALTHIYYTTIDNDKLVPLTDWQKWAK